MTKQIFEKQKPRSLRVINPFDGTKQQKNCSFGEGICGKAFLENCNNISFLSPEPRIISAHAPHKCLPNLDFVPRRKMNQHKTENFWSHLTVTGDNRGVWQPWIKKILFVSSLIWSHMPTKQISFLRFNVIIYFVSEHPKIWQVYLVTSQNSKDTSKYNHLTFVFSFFPSLNFAICI